MTKQIYFNEFAETKWDKTPVGWSRVQREFETYYPEPHNVLYADYNNEDYQGEANIIWRNEDGTISYVSGSHCSCSGLEDQWSVETYPLETVHQMIDRARQSENKWSKSVFGIDYEKLEGLLSHDTD